MTTSRINCVLDYSYMNEYRLQEKYSDVKVRVEGRIFSCHKIILASLEFFRTILSNETTEQEIELRCMGADDFEILLTYIYGGSVTYTGENVFRLLKISHVARVKSLEDSISAYIVENAEQIPVRNAVDIFILAGKMGNEAVQRKFVDYVAENLTSVSKYPHFVCVTGAKLLEILRHPNCDKSDSSALVEFLVKWVRIQPAGKEDARTLLYAARQQEDVLPVSMEWALRTLILNYSETGESKSSNVGESSRRRRDSNFSEDAEDEEYGSFSEDSDESAKIFAQCHDEVMRLPFLLYSATQALDEMYVHKFDNHWNPYLIYTRETMGLQSPLAFRKLVRVQGVLFMVTAFKKEVSADRVELDFSCQEFRDRYNRNSYRTRVAVNEVGTPETTVCNDVVYVYDHAFGFCGYDCELGRWVDQAGPLQRGHVRTASSKLLSHQDSLYLVGGKYALNDESHHTNMNYRYGKIFQRYDVREGIWARLPNLLNAHSSPGACIYPENNVLYVSGGDHLTYHKKSVEGFDFIANKWFFKNEYFMPEPKMNHFLIPHDKKLWFFGGQKYENRADDSKLSQDLSWFWFDLETNTWSNSFSLTPVFKSTRLIDVQIEYISL